MSRSQYCNIPNCRRKESQNGFVLERYHAMPDSGVAFVDKQQHKISSHQLILCCSGTRNICPMTFKELLTDSESHAIYTQLQYKPGTSKTSSGGWCQVVQCIGLQGMFSRRIINVGYHSNFRSCCSCWQILPADSFLKRKLL